MSRAIPSPSWASQVGAVLLVDLDHFRYVNAAEGRSEGDALLAAAEALLRDEAAHDETVTWLGGDEFAVLIGTDDVLEAARRADAIVTRFRDAAPGVARGVTASVGIAPYRSGCDPEAVLGAAELAVRSAKAAGGAAWALGDTIGPGEPGIDTELGCLRRLRRAVHAGDFVVHAQPIVGLQRGLEPLQELLVRMPDSGRLIPPGAFLPLAERAGLAADIDRFVLREAIDHLEASRTADTICVNVSATSLRDPHYTDTIRQRLAGRPALASGLVFEITETAAVTTMDAARAFADLAHDLGARLAVDDFGAGCAPFTLLRQLPFDILKIDGQFVRDAAEDAADRSIVRCLAALAHDFDITVVGEHCHSADLAAVLREEGVDYAQGHHFGAAVPLGTRRT